MYLNFKAGLSKFSGLKEMAVNHGVLVQTGSTFQLEGDKIGYYKNWKNDEAIWKKILPELEEKLNKAYSYST